MRAIIAFFLIETILTGLRADEQLKAVTHMMSVWQSALALNKITQQLEAEVTVEDANCKAVVNKFHQAVAGVMQDTGTEVEKAALPVVIRLAQLIADSEPIILARRAKVAVAAIKAANLTGHQFAAAALGELQVPNIKTGQDAGTSIRTGAGNIYLEQKQALLDTRRHADFNAKAAKMAAWTKPGNFDGFKIYQPTLVSKGEGTTRAPFVGQNKVGGSGGNTCSVGDLDGPAASGDSSTNICTAPGLVLTMTEITIKKQNDKFGKTGTDDFCDGDHIHHAQAAANAVNHAINRPKAPCLTFDTDDLASFKADDNFKAAVGALFGNLDRKTSLTPDNSQIKTIIKQVYGEGAEMKTKFWEKLKTIKKPSKILGEDASGDITTVTSLVTAFKLFLETKVKESKHKQQAAAPVTVTTGSEKETETKKEDECKKHTTEKLCKSEKGCDFDEKKPEGQKCFPKAETEKKDEKSFSRNLRVSVPHVFAAFAALLF
uniref:Variant surface glycoprotein 560 n=1 Tax=Trypanosoma brucei TaxID=5691 RepID=M4SXC3_9TRYP|nr:variant surface glycoprotein 560 [Trypanosoma brucei]